MQKSSKGHQEGSDTPWRVGFLPTKNHTPSSAGMHVFVTPEPT